MDQANFIPLWEPSEQELKESNIAQALLELKFKSYLDFHQWSVQNREQFWDYTIQKLGIVFQTSTDKVLTYTSIETPQWLPGAKLNIVDSCFQALTMLLL